MYVQFSDETQTRIINVFAEAQDQEFWPNQGEIEETDSRYIAWLDSREPSPLEKAQSERDRLLGIATLAVNPLQDAVDLEVATDAEVALLKLWKQYRIAVNRLDLTQEEIAWPLPPG